MRLIIYYYGLHKMLYDLIVYSIVNLCTIIYIYHVQHMKNNSKLPRILTLVFSLENRKQRFISYSM